MTLIVGDLHAMPSNLEDTGLLLQLVANTCRTNPKIKRVVFTGDIFHTHAVVRQEAAYLVKKWMLEIAATGAQVLIMAGNHDGSSPDSVEKNAVRLVFGDLTERGIVAIDDERGFVHEDLVLIPFIGDNALFVEMASQYPDKILICHQTVEGAHYENRTLAPGGVKQELLPQKKIIAGHIHMTQTVGKVFYPGTPRALNANEYNETKGIYLFDDAMENYQMIPTGHLVKEFHKYFVIMGSDSPTDWIEEQKRWKPKDDVSVVISGSNEFYESTLANLAWAGDRIKIIPDIRKTLGKTLDVDSEGATIESAFHQYVHEVYDAKPEERKMIWDKIQQIVPTLGNSSSI